MFSLSLSSNWVPSNMSIRSNHIDCIWNQKCRRFSGLRNVIVTMSVTMEIRPNLTQYIYPHPYSISLVHLIENIWREYTNYEIYVEEARTFSTQIFNEGDLNFISVKQLTGTTQGKIYHMFLKRNLGDIVSWHIAVSESEFLMELLRSLQLWMRQLKIFNSYFFQFLFVCFTDHSFFRWNICGFHTHRIHIRLFCKFHIENHHAAEQHQKQTVSTWLESSLVTDIWWMFLVAYSRWSL